MEPFKNLLGIDAAKKIATVLKRTSPEFSSSLFLKNLESELEPLELKARMLLIKDRLHHQLPTDPKASFQILQASLKKTEEDRFGLSGFLVWPLTQFVSDEGQEHFDLSMSALHAMTKVFTAEFAIRPFLLRDEKRTLRQLMVWAKDEDVHVRRLASEGSRPLLPWGQKIPAFVQAPEKTWPILELLKNDPEKYVQKSVANHLNDHSKNHGDWLIERLTKWSHEESTAIDWIIRHGTRTLVKKGHVGALRLHGITPAQFDQPKIRLRRKSLRLGEALELEVVLKNPYRAKSLPLLVDVEIQFLKSNGAHSAKVFKGKKLELLPDQKMTFDLRLPLRKVTTRVHYPGLHGCTVLLNGKRQDTLWFTLET